MSRFALKSIATLSLGVVAAASQASVITQNINLFVDYTGGASITTSLQQFHPWMGTLNSVTLNYEIAVLASNTVTNIDSASGLFNNFVYDESYLSVHDLANTQSMGDDLIVTDSHTNVALAGGASDSVGFYVAYTNTLIGNAAVMTAFTGGGTLAVDQSSLGFAVAGGSAQTQSTGFEYAGSVGTLTYDYTKPSVPAPAAAASMVMGLVGSFVRRRKSA